MAGELAGTTLPQFVEAPCGAGLMAGSGDGNAGPWTESPCHGNGSEVVLIAQQDAAERMTAWCA
ncbi:MAG TPA: hypothetical protein DEF43_10950 [Chloroflexus aurantiacus]|jgi:hypothetical protein|nr:MAG: hypothetical protein D6716_08415 [Chloroflexota bacterium]HBW67658.1 hypothetical protein [Chloroflexus aurantiacus]